MRDLAKHPEALAISETEQLAGRLILNLEGALLSQIADEHDAQRNIARLRFALDRVEDLRRSVREVGGVFEPARLEVAQSILQTFTIRAAAFVATTNERLRTERVRAADRATITKPTLSIINDDEPKIEQRKAA